MIPSETLFRRVLPELEPFELRHPAWMDLANCIGTDPDLFFPGKGRNETLAQAQEVCAGCQVRSQCLEHALANHENWGVWGGTSERERRRIRRKRARRAS